MDPQSDLRPDPTRPVYVAGPLFDEGERWWIETVEQAVAAAGFPTFLPHRDNPPKTSDNVGEIFTTNVAAIDACSVVVASLNGVTTDDGTAWEIGYAYGHGKHIIGIHTDWRRRFDDEVVNLMLERSLDTLVRSLDELRAALAELATRSA
ncbi:MAG: nucleoside 2-deoxyribosyltransferase [Actinomycetota bacterium]